MGFQLIKTAFLIRMSPTSGNSLTGNPQAQMILLTIASNRFFSRPLILMERISITKLKEFQVRILAISVTYNALQATEENTLAHNAQISAKRIHHFHRDRKSTRLNSSHANISYAVFCLKKKNIIMFSLFSLPTTTRL